MDGLITDMIDNQQKGKVIKYYWEIQVVNKKYTPKPSSFWPFV